MGNIIQVHVILGFSSSGNSYQLHNSYILVRSYIKIFCMDKIINQCKFFDRYEAYFHSIDIYIKCIWHFVRYSILQILSVKYIF